MVKTEPLKKRMYRNPKSPFEEVFEHHDLTWLWIGVPLALRHTPSCELLIVEYPHGDEVFNGLLVASRFPPFLRHDPAFFCASLFAMNLALPMNEEMAED